MIGTPEGGYRPGLDGIRAVAVSAVLLFHLDRLPGGNLGVDAFFVVSGWLITWKLLSDVERDGRGGRGGTVRVQRFWTGRLRRLLPASTAVLLAIALVWPLVGIDVPSLRRDLAWAAVGLSNWGTISGGGDYWARFGDPSPVTHYWSLAIEQQYYLLWPLVVLAVVAVARGAGGAQGGRAVRGGVAVVSLLGGAASVVFMNLSFDPLDQTATYMNTFARAHSLLLGAAAGALTTVSADGRLRLGTFARRLMPLGAAAALAIVLASSESSTWMFRWGFPAFAAAMTVVVVGVADGGGGRVMASRSAKWLADRSYGLYLWHWPVFLLLSPSRLGVDDGSWPAMFGLDVVRVAVSLAIADLSFRTLETPIRRRSRLPSWHAAVAACASLSLLGVLLLAVVPAPSSSAAESVVTLPPPPTATSSPSSDQVTQVTTGPDPAVDASSTTSPTGSPAPEAPGPSAAPTVTVPTVSGQAASSTEPASSLTPSRPLRLLVAGDSLAVHLADAMLEYAAERPDEFVAGSAAFGGCGLTASTDGRLHEFTDVNGERELLDISGCVDQWSQLPERVVDEAIDVVLVDIGPWDALDMHLADGRMVSVGDGVGRGLVADAYHRFADEVRSAGATVVWVTPADTRLGWGAVEDPVNDPARWRAVREIVDDLGVVQVDLPGWLVAEGLDGPDGRPDGVHLGPGLDDRFVEEMVAPVLRGLTAG